MSAIASFICLPISAMGGLRDAATPEKRWIGRVRDTFWDYLRSNGHEVVEYGWSGYVLATLLPYLIEKHDIDFLASPYEALANELSEARSATFVFLTQEHAEKYAVKLDGMSFESSILRDYYNEFNESEVTDIGEAMLDGIGALRKALGCVDKNSVILLVVA